MDWIRGGEDDGDICPWLRELQNILTPIGEGEGGRGRRSIEEEAAVPAKNLPSGDFLQREQRSAGDCFISWKKRSADDLWDSGWWEGTRGLIISGRWSAMSGGDKERLPEGKWTSSGWRERRGRKEHGRDEEEVKFKTGEIDDVYQVKNIFINNGDQG